MILTISSLAICLCLLCATVIVLRHNQIKEGNAIAERCAPLGSHNHDADLCQLKLSNSNSGEIVTYLGLQISDTDAPERPQIPATPLKCAPSTNETADFEEHFPMLGAFTKHCISLRKTIKDPATSQLGKEKALKSLYRNAAVAELLHSKTSDRRLSLASLKSLPEKFIDELDMPYQSIGFAKLKLLGKSDIKQLRIAWGEPISHQCPRDFHRERWDILYSHFG